MPTTTRNIEISRREITLSVMERSGINLYGAGVIGRYDPAGEKYFYIADHLGSTRAVVDELGNVVQAQDYYPFIPLRSISRPSASCGLIMPGHSYLSGTPAREGFTGKERDGETGFDYFGARYYNPALARWMNPDRLMDEYPGWSPYNYVLNNPLRLVDPDGRSPTPRCCVYFVSASTRLNIPLLGAFGVNIAGEKGVAWDRDGNIVLFDAADYGVSVLASATATFTFGMSEEMPSVDELFGAVTLKTGGQGGWKVAGGVSAESAFENIFDLLGAITTKNTELYGSTNSAEVELIGLGVGYGGSGYVSLKFSRERGRIDLDSMSMDEIMATIFQWLAEN